METRASKKRKVEKGKKNEPKQNEKVNAHSSHKTSKSKSDPAPPSSTEHFSKKKTMNKPSQNEKSSKQEQKEIPKKSQSRKLNEFQKKIQEQSQKCFPTSQFKKGLIIKVNDKMQTGYEYKLSERPGQNFADEFKPAFSPYEMLEYGVFEGKYLNDTILEFPKEYVTEKLLSKLSAQADRSKNYFGVKSRQDLSVWREKKWIMGDDPRGWFQWYFRYYNGRREPEIDQKQISRWKAFKRHLGQVEKNCSHPKDEKGGCTNMMNCRSRQRQGLLQWSYNPFIC